MKIVWFRRDLRTLDNQALVNALNSGEPVVAAYIATPGQWQQHNMAPIQSDLIVRRLAVVERELAALNIPFLYHQCEDYQTAVKQIVDWAQRLNASAVVTNREYEINEVRRDEALASALAAINVNCAQLHDRCLLPPGSVLNKQGSYFKVFTPFKRAWLGLYRPPSIERVSAQEPITLPADLPRYKADAEWSYPRVCSSDWNVETDRILNQLRNFCRDQVNQYDDERDMPALNATSRLSAYLAIGALSVRQCVARLNLESQGEFSSGAQVWLSELIWREFYQHLIYFEPKLVKGQGFVDWEPNLVWHAERNDLMKWQQGQTGYPIVDAAMRQLNQTGWMHNRLRMVVASFFTKDLHLDWRLGEQYFMSRLIDGDFAANNGGWQWCASTGCDGQPYFRIFNPISQGERFDPDGTFVRHWLPELSQVPAKYVHQPWNWSQFDTLDYPSPIVDHKREREIALARYKQAKG